jgi:predicted DnaQ family exonuclease/DinG family helicase
MNRIYVAIDLEFTGFDTERDDIIEIGMVKFRGSEILETFSSLVNPRREIPYKIEQLSGICQADLDQAPSLRSLMGQVLTFAKNFPVVGHNVETDLRFLQHRGLLGNNIAIDTFELASILVPEANRYSLASLTERLGISLEQNHRALPDAMATKDLFLALVERACQTDGTIIQEIARLAQGTDWGLKEFFRDILTEQQERRGPSSLEHHQDERPHLSIPGFDAEDWPALEPSKTIVPLNVDELRALISPGGPFARAFPGYEHRAQQVDMLEGVALAFNTPSHLLVEAGTGTGKSLAYLLPAISFAVQNGQRVVISSNTINLQDQLQHKDVPDLQRILGLPFNAAVLKGRSNYVCLRRLTTLRRSRQLDIDGTRVLAKVLIWLRVTHTGDRAELLLLNTETAIWSEIEASSETCLGERCPFLQTGRCYFYRAKARAERAHLVIVNHALLLSDLVLENRILPEYKYLIIDEAHHLEEQATDQFGFEAGRRDIYSLLVSLSHMESGTPAGLLAQVPMLFQAEGISNSIRAAMATQIQQLQEEIDTAQHRVYEVFNTLDVFLNQHASSSGRQEPYEQNISVHSGLRTQPDWTAVEIAWENFSAPMSAIVRGLERLLTAIDSISVAESDARDDLSQDIRAHQQRVMQMWTGMTRVLMEPEEEEIYWFSISRRDQEITLHGAPLQVATLLRDKLFNQKDCVVLTSATLRTENSFHFIKQRLGLEDPVELALDSPFHFETAVLLYVPKDVPEPNEPFYQKTVEQALIELARATEGRMLVLFTSNSQLNATYRAIQRPLDEDSIVVYGQGIDGSRRQILDNFRATPRAVLLGTRSFWEGVDVVGQALSCLVIARLPFAVPTDPVLSARALTFEDPFNQYYLPDSILRFRQGFGRLIRSKDDYGVVVVLDKRILTKNYGKTILRSLPKCTARQGPLQSLPTVARRWLDPTNRT